MVSNLLLLLIQYFNEYICSIMSLWICQSAYLLTKYHRTEDMSILNLRDTVNDYNYILIIMSMKWPMLNSSTREEFSQRSPMMQWASNLLGLYGSSWIAKWTQQLDLLMVRCRDVWDLGWGRQDRSERSRLTFRIKACLAKDIRQCMG